MVSLLLLYRCRCRYCPVHAIAVPAVGEVGGAGRGARFPHRDVERKREREREREKGANQSSEERGQPAQ
jgi:hypothetical protein